MANKLDEPKFQKTIHYEKIVSIATYLTQLESVQ